MEVVDQPDGKMFVSIRYYGNFDKLLILETYSRKFVSETPFFPKTIPRKQNFCEHGS